VQRTHSDIANGVPPPQQWAALALARLLLACIVANFHFRYTAGDNHPAAALGITMGAGVAVASFLTISGFSIAHSLERPRAFYRRRFGRIWPTLAVTTLAFAALIWRYHRPGRPDPDAWAILTTLLCLNGLIASSWFGPAWSLAVEVSYYAIGPLLRRLATPVIAALALASAIVHWNARRLGVHAYSDAVGGIQHLGLFWAWALGFLAFRLRGHLVVAAVLFACGVVLLARFNTEGGALWPVTWAIATAAVGLGDRLSILRGRALAVLDYLGDISYPLYLVHMPVYFGLRQVGLTSWWLDFPAALAAAAICVHLVERPFRKRLAQASEPARSAAEPPICAQA
jgi:peptidoglycan/LPS O-acetylase OafA/YrhL